MFMIYFFLYENMTLYMHDSFLNVNITNDYKLPSKLKENSNLNSHVPWSVNITNLTVALLETKKTKPCLMNRYKDNNTIKSMISCLCFVSSNNSKDILTHFQKKNKTPSLLVGDSTFYRYYLPPFTFSGKKVSH